MVKFIELLGSMSYIYTVIQNNFILLCCTGSYFLWLWLGTSHRRNNLFQETYSLVLRNELDNFFLFERKNFIWVIGFFFFFNFFLLPLIFLLFTRLSSDIQKKKKNDSKLFVNVLFNYSKYFFRFLSWSSEPIYLISRLHKNVQIKQQKKKRFCSNLLSPPTHNSTSLKTHTHTYIHTSLLMYTNERTTDAHSYLKPIFFVNFNSHFYCILVRWSY